MSSLSRALSASASKYWPDQLDMLGAVFYSVSSLIAEYFSPSQLMTMPAHFFLLKYEASPMKTRATIEQS